VTDCAQDGCLRDAVMVLADWWLAEGAPTVEMEVRHVCDEHATEPEVDVTPYCEDHGMERIDAERERTRRTG
jgi:hypothetical protein